MNFNESQKASLFIYFSFDDAKVHSFFVITKLRGANYKKTHIIGCIIIRIQDTFSKNAIMLQYMYSANWSSINWP